MRRKEAGFVVAQAAIFIGVIALVALPAQSANQMQVETTLTSSRGQLAFTSGVSPQGLQLRVMLNSSSVQSHGTFRASVEVFNTVNRNVSFPTVSENQKISEWNQDDYFCPASFLLGFAVFQGHFAAGNISSAGPPLKVAPESVVFCAASPISGAVTFLPGGDRAVVGSGAFANQATLQLNATTKYINCKELAGSGGECDLGTGPGLVGYWNYSVPAADDMNFTSPGFVYFPPGQYTIVAADDWNQNVYATFVVEPSPPAITFASGATSDGLQLELTLNATTMSFDGAITGQMRVVNTLDQNVTVPVVQSQNLTTWSSYTDVCPSGYFMGYAVFPGHFTAGNISSAGPPLERVPGDTGIICPPSAYLPPNPQSSSQITFLPGPALQTRANETFDIKTAAGSFITPSYLVPDQLSVTTILSNTQENCGCVTPGLVGYYQDIGNGIFTPFSHGEYTIVAWDDWNQYVYATFVVQSPTTSSTTSTTTVDPTGGFPRNAAGGWDVNYVGSDPNPIGCNYSLGSTFGEGYSLSVYSEFDAVKAGGLVCISIVLHNVNGTLVTQGNESTVSPEGFNITDSSSGKLVFQRSCISTDAPPDSQGDQNIARSTFECEDIWDTSIPSATGVVPIPGIYTITAFATIPGTSGETPVLPTAIESVNFTILSSPVG